MILAGDVDPAGDRILHRLVGAPMAVFELFGLRTLSKSRQLVPQTDAEDGLAGMAELFQLLNDAYILRRVAGAVGEHDPVGIHGEDLLRRGGIRNIDDLTAPL